MTSGRTATVNDARLRREVTPTEDSQEFRSGAGDDAVEDDRDTRWNRSLSTIRPQACPGRPVDLLGRQPVAIAEVVDRRSQAGPFVGMHLAGHLLFEPPTRSSA